jgi:ABC-type sugar transport system ATPase subunit
MNVEPVYLRLRGACKRFGATAVLHDIDLEVRRGEFIVLVGPSGCGKSTLLRSIAGLEELTAGDIIIAGQRVNDIPPRDRDVAMVFQNYALYPHLSVRENLGFALSMRDVAAAEIAARTDEVAGMLGLSALLDRLPKHLSGGQRQRVAMGRAIMRKPKLFLFDEPLSNLDAKLRVQMRIEIAELHRRIGATSIFVTHDQVEAMTMADRIVLLESGRIQQVGTPRELYDAPANLVVATFIGSPAMNILAVMRQGDTLQLGDRGPGVHGLGDSDAPPTAIGLRPEALSVRDSEELADWSGTVKAVEDLGYQTFVFCEVAKGQTLCALGTPGHVPRIGAKVWLRADWHSAHAFDAAGRRMGCRLERVSADRRADATLRVGANQ